MCLAVGSSGEGLSFDFLPKKEFIRKKGKAFHSHSFRSVNPEKQNAGIASPDNIPGLLNGNATKRFNHRIAEAIGEQKAADSVQEQLASD